jgi:protein FAM32A
MAPNFTGGALSFKGDKKKTKKRSNKKKSDEAKHSLKQGKKDTVVVPTDDAEEENGKQHQADEQPPPSVEEAWMANMTDAERNAYKRKKERESIELAKMAKKSHRERVEDFNEKLSQLTEHNDLPRVSAAGNG